MLAPLIVTHLVLLEVLFYRLRHHYASHYQEIGAPTLVWRNSIATSNRVARYLRDKEYLAIADRRVNQLGDYARRSHFITTGVFGFAVFMFVVLAITVRL